MELKYYEPNTQTPPINKLICVFLGILLVLLLAFLYGIITAVNPVIYFGVIATIGFGMLFGIFYRIASKIAKVRDRKFVLISGIVIALLGVYFSWGAYISFQLVGIEGLFIDYITTFGFLTEIDSTTYIISQLYGSGAWEIRGIMVKGWILGLIWLLELGIIIYMVFKMLYTYRVGPFDERHNKWYRKFTLHDEYQSLANERHFREIEGVSVLEKMKHFTKGRATRYGRVSIYYLEEASQGYFLYENVGRDGNGKKEETTVMIDLLTIPKNDAKSIIDTYHGKEDFYFAY
ncbi:MAG: hypothetical protein AAFP76_07955 [Bacteroidota bacterium]